MTLRTVGISRRGNTAGSVPTDRIAASRAGVASVPSGARMVGFPPASRAASAAKSESPPIDSTGSPAGDTAWSMVRLPMQMSLGSGIGGRRGIATQSEVVAGQLRGQQVEQRRERLGDCGHGDHLTAKAVE